MVIEKFDPLKGNCFQIINEKGTVVSKKYEPKISNFEVLRLLIDNNENLKVVIVHGEVARRELGVPPMEKNVAHYPKALGRLLLPKGVAVYLTVNFVNISYAELDHICSEMHL